MSAFSKPLRECAVDDESVLLKKDPSYQYNNSIGKIFLTYFDMFLLAIVESRYSETKKSTVLTQALLYAVIYWSDVTASNFRAKAIEKFLEKGANPYAHVTDSKYRIIDFAFEKSLYSIFAPFLTEGALVIRHAKLVADPSRHSELNQVTRQNYQVTELCPVISLVRNPESRRESEHVFIIVEHFENGLPCMMFTDFIRDTQNPAYGRVRFCKVLGENTDSDNLLEQDRNMLRIHDPMKLIAKQWVITENALQSFVEAVRVDEQSQLHYALAGSRSLLTRSGSQGDNCYSWARTKLLQLITIGERLDNHVLQPSTVSI